MTYMGIGGPARWLFDVTSLAEMKDVLHFARHHGPIMILGAGSNTLYSDSGYQGVVMRLAQGRFSFVGDRTVIAEAGVSLPQLSRSARAMNLSGLEWAEGIPGRVGGAVTMNAGAFSGDMSQVVHEVTVLDADGRLHTLTCDELCFRYRGSSLLGSGLIVISATLCLKPGDPDAIRSEMARYRDYRLLTQPVGRTLGSTFKGVVTDQGIRSAGWYIEQAGLKGYRIGDAQFSDRHANFIMNLGRATSADVQGLTETALLRVEQASGVRLEYEIQIVEPDTGFNHSSPVQAS
ncbi:UDP-N-acetylmuramate dehydrogenase [Deinococcus multiflagellatus]|nr:UDP-N-acetylmuramate dehydrogenase [Deinococcus multiflagellatus]